jgi:hypothetical protein
MLGVHASAQVRNKANMVAWVHFPTIFSSYTIHLTSSVFSGYYPLWEGGSKAQLDWCLLGVTLSHLRYRQCANRGLFPKDSSTGKVTLL